MSKPEADEVEVQQCDRDAAADYGKLVGWPTVFRLHVREGKHDDNPAVQTIAKVRLAAEAKARAEAVAACEGERLGEPQPGTSDEAYESAITHCTEAILERDNPPEIKG